MRTTVTLDEDVAAALRQLARERGVSFGEALNSCARRGLAEGPGAAVAYQVPARYMGLRPGVHLDKSLWVAGEVEDAEVTGTPHLLT